MGGISPIPAAAGIQGLDGRNLDLATVSYSSGAFTVGGTNANVSKSNFTHTAVGEWTFNISNFAKTLLQAGWANADTTSSGAIVNVYVPGGFTVVIYSRLFSSGAFAASDAFAVQLLYVWE